MTRTLIITGMILAFPYSTHSTQTPDSDSPSRDSLIIAQSQLLHTLHPSQSQQTIPASSKVDGHQIRVEVRLVVLHATVLDSKENLVTDLTRDQFHVFENKTEQKITHFEREDTTVSMGLVIDNSSSMEKKRPKVNSAAMTLISCSNPKDEAFVTNFADEPYRDVDMTSDPEEMKKGLQVETAHGNTAFYDALLDSLRYIKTRGKNTKKALVAVTDGEDTFSKTRLNEILQHAHQDEVLIYMIGLLSEENARSAGNARKAMTTISQASGGMAFFPQNVDEVESIAKRIANDIRNQYTLAYTPALEAHSTGSALRTIQIKIQDPKRRKLIVRTRTGYLSNQLRMLPKE